MSVIEIKSAEEYSKAIDSHKITVALFYADWAEQCHQVLDALKEIAAQQPEDKIQFLKVPAEELDEISLLYKIDAVPTVIFFQKGHEIDRVFGVNIAELTTKCKKHISNEPEEPLEERLKKLINQAKVMIFMKGSKERPFCGFSKQLIMIMNETGIPYSTFDILQNEEVRQGLKTYSDWPTYPQLYVNGELIGGLDIVKELQASGTLLETLKG